MTKFETFGVQLDAETKQQAMKSFQWSCNYCCYKGMKLDCDRCAIAQVHRETIAIFDDLAKTDKVEKKELKLGGRQTLIDVKALRGLDIFIALIVFTTYKHISNHIQKKEEK